MGGSSSTNALSQGDNDGPPTFLGEQPPPWPRDLLLLRWAFVVASAICVAQMVQVDHEDVRLSFDVYAGGVILSLTSAACVSGWMNKSRAFVALALGSQVINAFVTGYYVLSGVTILAHVGGLVLPHVLPRMIWNVVVLAFAATVVFYLGRRRAAGARA